MKISVLLLIMTVFQLRATETYSQMARLTLNLTDVKISEALQQIEKQSEFYFLYSPKLINVEQRVNLIADQDPIFDILNEIFGDEVHFAVHDRQILITPKETKIISESLQQKRITGIVTEANSGNPLPGVNVVVQGTTIGTMTDIDGKYTIDVPNERAVLEFSFISYSNQAIPVGNQTTINVVLRLDETTLDEIVVIGYGTQKKSLITGAISSIDIEQISSVSSTSAEQTLQGRTAGVYVLPNSGAPGSSTRIRIRGVGSNGIAEPLFIVDGVRSSDIAFLNPNDIGSMEILKDAASAAIYGAEGANGVVIITTKSGKKNAAPIISYSGQFGIQTVGDIMPIMNPAQYTTYMTEAGNPYAPTPAELAEAGEGTEWLKEVFKPAPMSINSINVSGGSEKSSYLIGGSMSRQEGIAGGDKAQYNRYTFRVNSDTEIKPWLNFRSRLTYSNVDRNILPEDQETGSGSLLYNAVRIDPLTPVIYTGALPDYVQQAINDGYNPVQDADGNYYGCSKYVNSVINPFAQIDVTHIKYTENRLQGSLAIDADLLKGLKFNSTYSIDYRATKRHQWIPTYWAASQVRNILSSVIDNNYDYFMSQFENYFTYNGQVNNHKYNLLIGTSSILNTINNLYGYSANMFREEDAFAWHQFNPPEGKLANGYQYQTALLSFYGRISYDYLDKYIFNATLRRDGSSLLPPENRWGLFPSASLGWVVSKENFFNVAPIDFLRVRASWGRNGSLSNLSPGGWASAITSQNIGYADGLNQTLVGAEPTAIENRKLVWETSEQLNFGLDVRFLNDRLVVTADYFNKTTKDLLTPGSPPGFVGFGIPTVNGGNITNKGFEFEIGFTQSEKVFNYEISLNATAIKNEVTYLNPDYPRIQGASIHPGWIATAFEVGYPVWYFRGYKTDGIFQTQEEITQYIADNGLTGYAPTPGDVRIVNVNGDNIISPDDQTYIGSPHPDFMFGGRIRMEYKGFDFLVFAQGQVGNEVMIGFLRTDTYTNNRPTFLYEDRWTGPGSTNSWFKASLTNKFNLQSDMMVFDASFMRIRQLQIGYKLPNDVLRKINVKNLRIYLSLDNYFTFTKYPGLDPEAGSESRGNGLGIDRVVYPVSKLALAGITLDF